MNKSTGFSLIELMVVVALAAILLGIGIPSFTNTIKDNRLTSQANTLLTSLTLARSEAIKRRKSVTVCPTTDQGDSCTDTTSWEIGWAVFVDSDGDGTRGSEELVQLYPALEANNTLTGSRNAIRFGDDGLASGFNGTWTLCDDRGAAKAKGIIVSNTGRARVAQDSDNLACP
ncbi:GspH/FimT family pseudopilin [Guyparkeria halophila]|uniref:GspH/FimT family pseudopilin n=1 Tax=Guyparkeria halophila TaxID=47960 RepID=UPI0022AFB8DB|nr:GspH/FimT family pseudopilin [Guyparkeria halophila]